MSREAYGIHWFRRDLRLTGNPALERNLKLHPGRVLGVFCFDRKFLSRPDFSTHRFYFFLETLENLRDEMRKRGGDLLFLDEGPSLAFPALLGHLRKIPNLGLPRTISWNRDYEPFARERDSKLSEIFEEHFGLETLTERDHLFIEPTELSKGDAKIPGGGFYQVYTPFKNKWMGLFESKDLKERLDLVRRGLKNGAPDFTLRWPAESSAFPIRKNLLEDIREETASRLSSAHIENIPHSGHAAARKLLEHFKNEGLESYDTARDIPSLSGTSKMSVYLKNGSITVPQIIALLDLSPRSPDLKYFQELIWREFYYHILYHRPDVEHQAFLPKFRELEWENSRKYFKAWCEGRTGYPIVDAGMRQLAETGWMHNRVRMIVASFLTKDLLIDYRWGEKYFMEKLLDGDLAPNNGGWQWAASTGCDPQPYFRIFNPTSQGLKFDPDGKYVRRWVPELADRPDREIHDPLRPIVDHAKRRELALALYKKASN
jgi:deoxyribodipyrimidine photo-lyase